MNAQGGAGSQPIETGVDAAASTAIKATNDATYAKPNKVQRSGNKDQLDSMLGNLQVTCSSLSSGNCFYICTYLFIFVHICTYLHICRPT